MTRYDHRTGQARNVTVYQFNPSGIDPAKMKYRFQWTAPILISPHDPKTVYHAANVLFRTRDGGQTWETVSERPDAQRQAEAAVVRRPDHRRQHRRRGLRHHLRPRRVAEAEGAALGRQRRRPGPRLARTTARRGTNVTANIPDLPDWGTVRCIEASRRTTPAPRTSSSTTTARRLPARTCGRRPTSARRGRRSPTASTPATHCHVVREDPKKKGLLYLGTERGVMFSPDAGQDVEAAAS